MATAGEPTAKLCPTCGWPKYRAGAHADWCWTADRSQPVVGTDLIVCADGNVRTIEERDARRSGRHPEACALCGCIRRHGHWCPFASVPSGRSSGGGGEALGEVSLVPASIEGRVA